MVLPLYLVHALAGWLLASLRYPLVTLLVWLLLWPVLVTVRGFVMPLQAAGSRRAELRADQGAARAGHRAGLRRALVGPQRSFEVRRNGWTEPERRDRGLECE